MSTSPDLSHPRPDPLPCTVSKSESTTPLQGTFYTTPDFCPQLVRPKK